MPRLLFLFCRIMMVLFAVLKFPGIRGAGKENKADSLMAFLRHFNASRHHVSNPTGKKAARQYIIKTFQELGLVTWTETFKPDFPEHATGVNVVGMLPGRHAGTHKDSVILIGAHYDTMRTTSHGVDDNGSGVATLLQVAKQLTTENNKCKREFTIMFVSFDFEEWEDCSNKTIYPKCACKTLGCGSRAFVFNFTQWFNGKNNSMGSFQGAVIMDTVMNYNATPNSQSFPNQFEQILPEVYKEVQDNEYRGDFISVTARKLDDNELLDTFSYFYRGDNEAETGDRRQKFQLVQLKVPFYGPPNKLPPPYQNAFGGFFRSDHYWFWWESKNKSSMSAIFLSDTANYRGYMKHCYHEDCDSMKHVTSDFLWFMAKTSDAIVDTANYMAMITCPPSQAQAQGGDVCVGQCYKPWVVGVTAFLVAVTVLVIGAVISSSPVVVT